MDFQAKQQQALAILDRTGMRRSSDAPPLLQILCFGLSMAVYYAHGKKKYRLPSWDSLGGR